MTAVKIASPVDPLGFWRQMKDFSGLILTKLTKGFTEGRKASLHWKTTSSLSISVCLHIKPTTQLSLACIEQEYKETTLVTKSVTLMTHELMPRVALTRVSQPSAVIVDMYNIHDNLLIIDKGLKHISESSQREFKFSVRNSNTAGEQCRCVNLWLHHMNKDLVLFLPKLWWFPLTTVTPRWPQIFNSQKAHLSDTSFRVNMFKFSCQPWLYVAPALKVAFVAVRRHRALFWVLF